MKLTFKRLAAYAIDLLIVSMALVLPQLLLYLQGISFTSFLNDTNVYLWVLGTVSLPTWIYFIAMENSLAQVTLGKKLMKLKVISIDHKRITLNQALTRTLIKLLP